jgi:uncharacterized damage-inducible protein DinB
MADHTELFTDAFARIKQSVDGALADLSDAELSAPPAPEANTIAWLVWHLTRIMDDHVADVAGDEQVWTRDGWAQRFDLPFPDEAIGYGQTADEVRQVRVSGELLLGYHDAVQEKVVAYVRSVSADDLDRVVDTRWDPPVTLAVRLVSVVNDSMQHVGQAAYVRGILLRAR